MVFSGKKPILDERLQIRDHGQAAQKVLDCIGSATFKAQGIADLGDLQLVGHRVVHGGERYADPVEVNDNVIAAVEQLESIAPLHNAGALAVMRATRARLARQTPEVAVFDTGFHRALPDRARLYAIPWKLARRYRIRRYGFHGISHKYLSLRYAELTRTPVKKTNIITLHLEGGSSATLVKGGKPIDTSMGFTPLEGLMMGTRSGDIDPALIRFLAQKEGVDAGTVEEWLNKESGLLGVSGSSQDTRVLVKRAAKNRRSELALEMFAYRVRKYIGAYLAASGGVSAVVFGGGIGENTPDVRRRICEGLSWFGLELDRKRNARAIDREDRITKQGSRLHAYVIPTEEGLMIAHEALRCADLGTL